MLRELPKETERVLTSIFDCQLSTETFVDENNKSVNITNLSFYWNVDKLHKEFKRYVLRQTNSLITLNRRDDNNEIYLSISFKSPFTDKNPNKLTIEISKDFTEFTVYETYMIGEPKEIYKFKM